MAYAIRARAHNVSAAALRSLHTIYNSITNDTKLLTILLDDFQLVISLVALISSCHYSSAVTGTYTMSLLIVAIIYI